MDEDRFARPEGRPERRLAGRDAGRRAPRGEGAWPRGALAFALSAAAVLALSLGIAWPLWLAATELRGVFNALFAAAALAAAACLAVLRIRARAARERAGGPRKAAGR
jgi:hypothetical protein